MVRGIITTANRDDESEILKAGFVIHNTRTHNQLKGCYDFTVEGPDSAVDNIDKFWGEWVWSLSYLEAR